MVEVSLLTSYQGVEYPDVTGITYGALAVCRYNGAAPVAQWIEHATRRVSSRVRFSPGVKWLPCPGGDGILK